MGASDVSSEVSSGATSASNSDTDVRQKARELDPDGSLPPPSRSEAAAQGDAAPDASADPLRERSQSISSEEGSDTSRRKRRKKEKKEKKDKSLKVKKKKKSKSKDKDKKKKRKSEGRDKDKGPVQLSKHLHGDEKKYSVISGKKIRLKIDKTKEDIEAEKKRKDLLASLNEMYN